MNFIKYILLIVNLSLSVLLFAQNGEVEGKPNIIFIMSDDHAAHAIGSYGGRLAGLNMTPNLDKLATEGMRFENAFCNNSICTPSRASIITGQYPQTNGVLDLDHKLDTDRQHLPIELKKLGYSTAIIGKWHLKNEPVNFDYYKVLPSQGRYNNPIFNEKGKGEWPKNKVENEGHSSDIITNSVIEHIKNRHKHITYHGHYFEKAATNQESAHQAYQHYLRAYLRLVKGVDDNVALRWAIGKRLSNSKSDLTKGTYLICSIKTWITTSI